MAKSALSKNRIIPKKRKNTPKPVSPIPISDQTQEQISLVLNYKSIESYCMQMSHIWEVAEINIKYTSNVVQLAIALDFFFFFYALEKIWLPYTMVFAWHSTAPQRMPWESEDR